MRKFENKEIGLLNDEYINIQEIVESINLLAKRLESVIPRDCSAYDSVYLSLDLNRMLLQDLGEDISEIVNNILSSHNVDEVG